MIKYLIILSLLFIGCEGLAQKLPKPVLMVDIDSTQITDSFTLLYNKWFDTYAVEITFIKKINNKKQQNTGRYYLITYPETHIKRYICPRCLYSYTDKISDATLFPSKDSALFALNVYIKDRKENEDRKKKIILEGQRIHKDDLERERKQKDFKPVKDNK